MHFVDSLNLVHLFFPPKTTPIWQLPPTMDGWDRALVGPRVEMPTVGSGVPYPGERGCPWVGPGEPLEVEGETKHE